MSKPLLIYWLDHPQRIAVVLEQKNSFHSRNVFESIVCDMAVILALFQSVYDISIIRIPNQIARSVIKLALTTKHFNV